MGSVLTIAVNIHLHATFPGTPPEALNKAGKFYESTKQLCEIVESSYQAGLDAEEGRFEILKTASWLVETVGGSPGSDRNTRP